ncbi:MAG TPA: hypothetical protein VF812_18940, partial [Ktedonobacterales bacterium]
MQADIEAKAIATTPTVADMSTRLSGRRLLAARLLWLASFVATVGMFLVQLPAYFVTVAHPNAAHPNAENAALSAGAVAALGHLGVTVSAFNWVAFGILCIVTLATLALAL